MRRTGIGAGIVVLLAASASSMGCATQTKQRNRVLEAENLTLHQEMDTRDAQLRDMTAKQDQAYAEAQQKETELARLRVENQQNAEARAQLAIVERELVSAKARAAELDKTIMAQSRPDASPGRASSPQLEAFRSDLQARLSRFNVTGVDVDVRTAKDGQRRVAVVLQNAFRPGSASLSYNASAVKAVVGLGKLISESYGGARVMVEGHTDSDQITKSKWASNEELSLARAEEVRGILDKAGVPGGRVSAVGMGARHPVATGATARAKAQNRRVEIYILPNG
jgi:flagellar motor protein MotB